MTGGAPRSRINSPPSSHSRDSPPKLALPLPHRQVLVPCFLAHAVPCLVLTPRSLLPGVPQQQQQQQQLDPAMQVCELRSSGLCVGGMRCVVVTERLMPHVQHHVPAGVNGYTYNATPPQALRPPPPQTLKCKQPYWWTVDGDRGCVPLLS
eukprot:2621869-Rhodomonas_salina.1